MFQEHRNTVQKIRLNGARVPPLRKSARLRQCTNLHFEDRNKSTLREESVRTSQKTQRASIKKNQSVSSVHGNNCFYSKTRTKRISTPRGKNCRS
jgi:hypothetical protein